MSLYEIREYIKRRLKEGVEALYGSSGLAGEVARKFGLKLSTAGYRVWEVVRSETAQTTILGEKLEEDLEVKMEVQQRELIKGAFTLETELEKQILLNLEAIEAGLRLKGRQYRTGGGVIDILAEDKNGDLVIIELKSGDADIEVLGQILKYMTSVRRESPQKNLRGIIIAHEFDDLLIDSVKSFLGNIIKLMQYELKIELREVI